MKPVVNKALAVGFLVAVTGAAFLVALTFFKKGGYSKSESYLVRAHFTDATGLTWKSRVQIAGIQVGEVDKISLDGARALLQIRVKNEVDLREDACLYKTFPSALLPDALLEVAPGKSARAFRDMPEGAREITCIREATSVQQLLDSMARIAADVQTVTGDLAQTVTGNNGSLRNIVENLAATTGRLRLLVDENGESVSQILRNTRDFTRDLRDMSGRDKDRVHDILVNVDELTAQLRTTAASLDALIKGTQAPARGGEGGDGEGVGGEGGPGGAVAEGGAPPEAGPQARGVQQAVEKLNDSLAKLDELLGKVREGKSTAGRLLVDERMGRQVGSAVEGLSDYFDRASRMQVRLQLRSEWLLNQSVTDGRPGAKVYFGLRLTPRPDKYFELELASDPRGVDTVTNETITTTVDGGTSSTTVTTKTKNEQKLALSLQMGKRFGRVTLRGGLIETSGGLGADLHLLDDSLRFSLSMYQFNRPQNTAWPRTKLWVDYTFMRHFYITTGVDDFLNRWETSTRPGGRPFSIGTDVFFGAGLFFNDDDVKMLLTSGVAGGAASAAR